MKVGKKDGCKKNANQNTITHENGPVALIHAYKTFICLSSGRRLWS
jgi:hypothetical protein